ncbi:type I polyketide synthase [Pandoraea commovens]|uniref:SDR family NAD(P)-dependent oxidoreductase n=1 Tax=Pandoraea commovens TaxID=2508289 RepID=A0ABY5QDN3_9BURK|nr:type I polyketide synthase [Pandoraea commovens]UVA78729.1 SDR family NAD(P)-dependent oxidoreductase [Pandoraea commovens]
MNHGAQLNQSKRASDQVAVVGIGCRYPGAQGVKEFWENILAKRQQFRPIPACRLSKQGYFSSDRRAEDQTYAWQAAVIDGYAFDWQARRIPKSTFESTDIAHWLALDTAISMLEDAGYVGGERLPRESTRVIVGNTLTGETTRAYDLRLRWPYVLSCVRKALASSGWNADTTISFENRLKEIYKRSFPEANEDSLAGGLSNTIAGRIANYLDLNGGCYTIDGACSSSLLAIHAAATCLIAGQCDFVIAGGVDISLDPFELVGFAKAGALTPTQMRVYDDRGNGFIPGEGSGFVGLKRLSDAIESHDKIYAVLDGWGMSSDGRGGIIAPSARGQHLSQAHAYRLARVSPEALDFVEGHGTGTAVGDRAELNALGMTLSSSDDAHVCGITSLKSIVGHTKAAAGIGAFIKSVIAVNQRVLPPTAGCDEPHQAFSSSARALFPAIRGRAFCEADVLRAGVSAMGFGGVNVHVTLRSYVSPPASHLRSDLENRSAMASWQDSEVFPLTASSSTELRHRVANLRRDVEGISLAELSDLAAHCARNVDLSAPWRAAIVSASPEQLSERLARLDTALIDANSARPVSDREHEFTFGRVTESPRVGLLFPGQGAQRLGMAGALMERYRWARRSAEQAEQWAARYGAPSILKTMHPELDRFPHQAERESLMNTLQRTEWAQPSIVLASLIWLQMLTRLGIRPNCVAGHSLGELVAFHAAGAYGMQTAVELAAVRGREMAAGTGAAGAMLSLACTRLQAQRLIGEAKTSGYAVLANINSERQMVVSGEIAAIDVIEKAAISVGTAAVRLPVSHAFHSKLVEHAADAVGKCAPIARDCDALTCVLISSIDGLELSPQVELKEHFARQIVSPVDFVQTLNSLARHVDVVLEVGPGNVLTNLSRNVTGTRDLPCFPVESKSETWRDINWALANLHVLGSPIVWRELHAERVIRPFIPARSRVFIANPCECLAGETLPSCVPGDQIVSPPEIATSDTAREAEKTSAKDVAFDSESLTPAAGVSAWPVLRRLSAQITGFAEAAIVRESRPLDDLNMDSIKTANLISRASEAVGIAPGTLDAVALSAKRLGEIADAMTSVKGCARAPAEERSVMSVLLDEVSRVTGFDKSRLTPDARLLDDLNLDSIKAAALLAGIMRVTGVEGGGELVRLANATLQEIAAHVSGLAERVVDPSTAPDLPVQTVTPTQANDTEAPKWVRAYEMICVPATAPEVSERGDGVRSRVMAIDPVGTMHPALIEALASVGVKVFDGLSVSVERVEHAVIVLPRRARSAPAPRRDYIKSIVEPLHRSVDFLTRMRCERVTFVQFELGQLFGLPSHGGESPSPETSCAQAFASSLRMERPELSVHILDFPSVVPDEVVVQRILESASDASRYRFSLHDEAGQPYALTPRVLDIASLPDRTLTWSSKDVLLATGGAKGITAELALAFARQTNATVVLVGKSPANNAEVRATVARYVQENLRVAYFACDLCDAGGVADLVRSIDGQFGSVTAVIHGAGVNVPRRIEQASVDDATQEVAPKLQSALSLAHALGDHPLKLVVGLGSVIGVTGMPGNAWYGFANQAMDVVLNNLAVQRPEVSTLTIDFSVWSDVGMGARMGSDVRLSKTGVGAIPKNIGVESFLGLILRLPPAKRIVVAGSLSGLETWQAMLPDPVVNGRFVERVIRYQPGVEIVCRPDLSPAHDAYLKDHEYHGALLFPTVFGLEAMAACAHSVLGISASAGWTGFRFENVVLERPVIASPTGNTRIEIRALVRQKQSSEEPLRVDVVIAAEQTGYRPRHFSCEVVFENDRQTPDEMTWPEDTIPNLSPSDLYGRQLFQGPQFQRIKALHMMDWSGARVSVETRDSERASSFITGDPYFRDGLLQTSLLVIQGDFLPAHIERIERFGLISDERTSYLVRNDVTSRTDDSVVSNVVAVSADGRVVEKITGYRIQRISGDERNPTPLDWVDPSCRDSGILHRALRVASEALTCESPQVLLRYTPELQGAQRSKRHAEERPQLAAVIEAALTARQVNFSAEDTTVSWDDNGRPYLTGAIGERFGVSLAHDTSHCLCVCGAWIQGCDVEEITCRDESMWRRILGDVSFGLMPGLLRDGDTLDEAGTRLWCAMEAAVKSLGKTDIQLALTQRSGDAVMLRGEGAGGARGVNVLTLPCELTRHPKKMFAFVVNRGGVQSEPAGRVPGVALSCATSAQSSGPEHSESQQPTFITKTRFRAAFKDTWPPVLTLSSGTIAEWMGRLREEHAVDFGRQILDKFDTGVFGMATNHSSVESIARPDTTDLVEGRFWFTRQYGRGDSTLDQNLEWHRIDAAGNSTLIARAKMTTSSTTIVSHGVIEPVNLPAFYGDWLAPRLAGLRDWLESHPSIDTPHPSLEWSTAASYVACLAPALESILCRKIFETSLSSGNLVGNVYFAHYYRWQDLIAEQYFRSISSEMPHPSAAREGFHCCSASVDHLREAMPFDRIEVVMALQALHADGLELRFEHYRLGDGDERIKLAAGSARYVWTHRTPAGIAICAQPLPRVLFDALKAACSSFRNESCLPKTDAHPLA